MHSNHLIIHSANLPKYVNKDLKESAGYSAKAAKPLGYLAAFVMSGLHKNCRNWVLAEVKLQYLGLSKLIGITSLPD